MNRKKLDYEQYWENGFLFPISIFDEKEALSYRKELEQIEYKYNNSNFLPLPINTYKRVNSQCVMPFSCEIALNKNILDAVEKIIGKDILLWSVEFFIKEPNSKSIVSMHQDLTYWGLDDHQLQVTAWLALSLSNKQSGCMDFVKGSFKNSILPHIDTYEDNNLLSRGQEIEVKIKEKDRVNIILNPGEISLHHGLTIHGSSQNNSFDRRIGVAIRYLNPKIKQIYAEKDFAILARGNDKYNNFIKYDPPKSLFDEKSLNLYNKIREFQSKALSRGVKENVSLYRGNESVY